METHKGSLQEKENSTFKNLKDISKKTKQDSPFEYQELKLKTKKKLLPLMRNLGLLDISKLRILEKYLLAFFDTASFCTALCLAQLTRYSNLYFQNDDVLYVLCPLVVILMVNYIFGLYRVDFKSSIFRMLGMVLAAAFVSLLFISFVIYLIGVERFIGTYFGRGILLGTIGGFSVLAFVHRFYLHKLFAKIRVKRNYLVLADSDEYHFLLEESKKLSEKENFDFLDSKNEKILFEKIEQNDYIGIIVGGTTLNNAALIKKLMVLRFEGFRVFNMQDFFEDVWNKIPVLGLEDQWFVMGNGFNLLHNPIELKIKRIFDVVFSLFIFLLAMPLMLVVCLLIKLESKGPVIYSQIRTGQRGKKFILYKFRTMVVDAESGKAQWAKKNDARITRIGKLLRIMRIDELPQFWNVFRGEMSFIGPRPERPELNFEIEKQIPYYNLRHLLKPGITGWAQVFYPYGASVQDALEKLQYDFYYIKNYGLLLDFSIIMKTVRVVLFGKGGR